jgi:hypothetical protein
VLGGGLGTLVWPGVGTTVAQVLASVFVIVVL